MLCCVGDLVEDVVVWLPGPMHTGSDTPSRISRQRGGSAANVAAVAARAGGRARFVGQIGTDALGTQLLAQLASVGVDVQARRAGRTGSIVVLVDPDGERTFLTDRAACTGLADPDDAWLDGISALHLPAYSLFDEPLASTCCHLAATARERSIPVTVDPSSTVLLERFGVHRFRQLLGELQPAVLFPNRREAEVLGIEDRPPDGVGLVVVKDGDRPVRLISAAEAVAREVPVPRVAGVADTTGAGDAFAAGFLVARTAGVDPVEAAARGNATAARVVREPGGDAWDGS